MQRIVVALTGATGVIYGIKLLKRLEGQSEIETHLIISEWAKKVIALETPYEFQEINSLANHNYHPQELTAPPASGSFPFAGMVIVPCSMKTLSAVANGYSHNLISRAADVMLKERRRLVLAVRETPLSTVHLENMLKLSRAGAVIAPPVPAFYMKPQNIDSLVDGFLDRVISLLGLPVKP